MAKYVSPKDIRADKTYTVNGVLWNEYLLKDHNVNNISLPPKRKETLLGITIHNTEDLANVSDDGRQYTAATINDNMGGVCTTLYIDELGVWQNLELDSMNYTCGDGLTGGGNSRTISFEVIMNGTTGSDNLKARDNAARVAAFLLYKYGLTVNALYTHNYWLNKRNGVKGTYDSLCTTRTPTRHCPYYILTDGNNGWEKFRKLVDSYLVQLGGKSVYKVVSNTTTFTSATTAKATAVQYIMKSLGTAAIRNKANKTGSYSKRCVSGDYYLMDGLIVNAQKEKWLKHRGTATYSMYEDGDILFSKAGTYKAYVATNKLNVRSAPSLSGHKMGILSSGATVYGFDKPTTEKDGYQWLRIVYNGKIAYVAKNYLKEGK
ncbi:MAG: N-acetylmuramoyl-L-alanine amidase [Bacteroides sp.]|nr:N-acetylmuramoyl-L-alanine amidase [Eubacterium sp.]MCM1417719.1 N-acetylmuramoyl-L-alanine amidase [Roseburia sp.]MCM1463521.1 N-acetylmuramoyl-L-alanine amidase [Bacteroides sp.]